nr:MAG TPA: hypothetical protein [Bacteriophage sp.]
MSFSIARFSINFPFRNIFCYNVYSFRRSIYLIEVVEFWKFLHTNISE